MRKTLFGSILGLLVLTVENVSAQPVTFSNIADTTTTAPGRGTFTSFGINVFPSISGNNVAFLGTYSGGNGIYTGNTTATGAAKIVDLGDTAPGHGPFTSFDIFDIPSISGNNVAFLGRYSGGSGIYTGSVGVTGAAKIVDTGNTAPGHGAFIGFLPPAVSGSNVAFIGGYSGGAGIYTGSVGATGAAKIVDTDNTAPGHGAFTSFIQTAISGSNIAFHGSYTGGSGIYTGSMGAVGADKIVDTGDNAPGQGLFTGVGRASISGSNITFLGSYSGGMGIYTGTVGVTGVTKIVDRTDTAPGHGLFFQFGNPSVSGNNVAFIGQYAGGSSLYLASGGSLSPLLNTGDALFGSTLNSLNVGWFGYDSNAITFVYNLADGRSGIGVATIAVPEPTTVVLVGMSLAGLGFVAWRKRLKRNLEMSKDLPISDFQ